jgi:hypothetical protein
MEPPAQLVLLAQKALQDVAAQTVDLLNIGPLLLAEAHNLSGLEVAVIEQGGQALLALAWQNTLENFPQLEAICLIGGLSTMIRLEFPSALLSECGDTQYTGCGV